MTSIVYRWNKPGNWLLRWLFCNYDHYWQSFADYPGVERCRHCREVRAEWSS